MASELKVDKFTGVTTAGSIDVVGEGNSTTTNLQQGLAKAFITVDVSQAAAFSSDDSFNIASVTDSATGVFGITFTNAMATSRYSRTENGIFSVSTVKTSHCFLNFDKASRSVKVDSIKSSQILNAGHNRLSAKTVTENPIL